jgi:pre-mRNA-splicing factor ATP-dependent RNA helicase DHX16
MTDSSDFTKLTSLKSVADLGQDYAIPHQNRLSHLSKLLQRQSLPICRFKDHILYALERYSILIIISETGTGKSTQIPQYLYEAGWTQNNRKIVCTQPRRIAALTISHRVADEMGVKVGNEVGYSMRFDSKVSEQTAIKYCTDGVLLRETMSDPLLMK